MKRLSILLLSLLLIGSVTSCKKYLDVNENPNAPQDVAPNLYLSAILDNMALAPLFDGRYIGKYSQMWAENSALNAWDGMGYQDLSDNNGEMWRAIYWTFGHNLENMIKASEAEERWDILGVGYVLKAWGWQNLTELHGEIILKQAYDLNRSSFDYDSQPEVYEEVERLLLKGIEYLNRSDGKVSSSYLAVGDKIYNGNRTKWKKFAYGLLAMSKNTLTNKRSYNPQEVITYVDSALSSAADDALVVYRGEQSANAFFYSPIRNNFNSFRQTEFIVDLLNGVSFGGSPDPRLSRMLAWSPDSTYNGIRPTYAGSSTLTTRKIPMNLLQYTSQPTASQPGKYIFVNNSSLPIMSYFQLQFVKAEAAFLKGDKELALETYKKAINAHFDFVNTATAKAANPAVQAISATDRNAFLAQPEIIPLAASDLTLSHIMSQKYIAQWGWAFIPTWTDLRRYHYEDLDPSLPSVKVFRGFTTPTTDRLNALNLGKVVYRSRPRYNSEYVWNRDGLDKIGGLAIDYHTKIMWLFEKD